MKNGKLIRDVSDLRDWLRRYTEYYAGDGLVDEEGNETDIAMLSRIIPSLDAVIGELCSRKENPKVVEVNKTIEDPSEHFINVNGQVCKLSDYIYTCEKFARESVNPNYRYCVVQSELNRDGYLTDDIGDAMECAARESRSGGMWYVLQIFKADDGTYRTRHDVNAVNGELMEYSGHHEFLHFNYIAQQVNFKKL